MSKRRPGRAPLSLSWRICYELAGAGPLTSAELLGRLPDLDPGIVSVGLELLLSGGQLARLDDGRLAISACFVDAFARAFTAWWRACSAQQEGRS
jgi:hypothetical protein